MARTARWAALSGALALAACGGASSKPPPTDSSGGATSEPTGGATSEPSGGTTPTDPNHDTPIWGIDCERPPAGARSPRWAGFERGMNLGNRLDAPSEGLWGAVLVEDDFDVAADAGFDHVRFPVRFNTRAEADPPYTLDETFMTDRVDWAIDQALDRGLNVLLDFHHYDELHMDVEGHRERFLSIWQQLAERYAGAPDGVAFELLNEPNTGLTSSVWNQLASEALGMIRETNPTRDVLIGATSWSNVSALGELELPDDPHVVAEFHFYEPLLFVFQGQTWGDPEWGTTGVVFPGPPPEPVEPVPAAAAVGWAAAWFDAYNTLPIQENPAGPQTVFDGFALVDAFIQRAGVPVYNGEFTAQDGADTESRARWIRLVREECERRDIGWAVWDQQTATDVYDHVGEKWNEPLRDALLGPMGEDIEQPCSEGGTGSGGSPGTGGTTGGGTAGEGGEGGAGATGPIDCEDTLEPNGPSGYAWCLGSFPGSSARFIDTPSDQGASASIADGTYSNASLSAVLTDSGTVDLSGYDELVFDADVPDGQPFEVWIGHDDAGCTYQMTGAGDTTYTLDLTEALWCEPTQCGFDLQASMVSFGSVWDEAEDLELTVKALSFEETSGGAGVATGREGAIGPGGSCWFIAAWNADSSIDWVEPPSQDSVHAIATSAENSGAALALELPDRPVDMTQFSAIEIDAIMSASTAVAVQLVGDAAVPEGCGWLVSPADPSAGVTTYTMDLTASPPFCYGTPPFDLTSAIRLDFATDWDPASDIEVEVVDVRFIE